jgi:hypothetical protein
MENITEANKCAHVPCQCEPEPGSDYCSTQCEKAVGETDCSCGHPDCLAEA